MADANDGTPHPADAARSRKLVSILGGMHEELDDKRKTWLVLYEFPFYLFIY